VSTSTDAYLVYGVMLKEGSLSSLGGNRAEPGTPKSLAYSGSTHYYNGLRSVAHCSSESPEYIVCAAEPWYIATRGYPEVIPPINLSEIPPAGHTILDYCKKHNLQIEGSPGWLLCSYWG
jgi:hypothetical protein